MSSEFSPEIIRSAMIALYGFPAEPITITDSLFLGSRDRLGGELSLTTTALRWHYDGNVQVS